MSYNLITSDDSALVASEEHCLVYKTVDFLQVTAGASSLHSVSQGVSSLYNITLGVSTS